jgi:hypothetical protein
MPRRFPRGNLAEGDSTEIAPYAGFGHGHAGPGMSMPSFRPSEEEIIGMNQGPTPYPARNHHIGRIILLILGGLIAVLLVAAVIGLIISAS